MSASPTDLPEWRKGETYAFQKVKRIDQQAQMGRACIICTQEGAHALAEVSQRYAGSGAAARRCRCRHTLIQQIIRPFPPTMRCTLLLLLPLQRSPQRRDACLPLRARGQGSW